MITYQDNLDIKTIHRPLSREHTMAFAGPNVRFIEIANYDYRVDRVMAWKEASNNPLIPIFLETIE